MTGPSYRAPIPDAVRERAVAWHVRLGSDEAGDTDWLDFESWLADQQPAPGFGECRVRVCTSQAASALRRFYEEASRDLTVEDIQLGLVEIAHPRARVKEAPVPALAIPRHRELTAAEPCHRQ